MQTLEQAYGEFPVEVITKFVAAANYVLENFVFKAWNEREMREKWRRRPLAQILESGEINHLFPCLDAAAIVAKDLSEKGEDVRLKLLTERGAVYAFRESRARALHIDALVEMPHKGIRYGVGIGCGDVTLYKQLPPENSDSLEERYLTTRPEEHERVWYRTPFLVVRGSVLVEKKEVPILYLLETKHNEVKVPYNITKEEFHSAPASGSKESFLTTNEDFNPDASGDDNQNWLAANLRFLPGLKGYKYIASRPKNAQPL